MPTTFAPGRPPVLPLRSLPTLTIFTHPSGRLVKTVPQLPPPARINGSVPRDTFGTGRTSPSDVVLADVTGPLSLLLVSDPLDVTIATLVLSVCFPDATNLQGASRRFVLPFRSFRRDPVSGELVPRSQVQDFDATSRRVYPGLGAGLNGLDGGSVWFFEDIGEEGAFDRYRWERDGVGRRAIWTVWLISTPSVVVQHLQSLLRTYPAPVATLPPWLKERNGYSWEDSYLALTTTTAASEEPSQQQAHIYKNRGGIQSSLTSQRPTPPTPRLKYKHERPHDESTTARASQDVGVSHLALEVKDNSKISEYRNSLVAVDNLTGQIAGVLASNIDLDPESTPAASYADSSDEFEGEAEEEQEAQTPFDEHVRIVLDKPHDLPLGHDVDIPVPPRAPALLDIDYVEDLPTPRISTFIHSPASVYRDADIEVLSSQSSSVLADSTSSPPPLPPKALSRHIIADAPPSRRTSTASAAFFSAKSDAGTASYDSDALGINTRNITQDPLPSAVSMHCQATETRRPELLLDPWADEDAAVNASGSTVGGPAVRLWRKAVDMGKEKSETCGGANDPAAQPRQTVTSRPSSKLSSCTGKAESAIGAFLDDDDAYSKQASTFVAVAPAKDQTTPLPTNVSTGKHLPRAAMCTDQVRSIEDQVWREAFDGGHLPIDAPYTHLAARGDADLYAAAMLSSPRSVDGSAIELFSANEREKRVHKKIRKQAQRADEARYMQGGTVLIDFLAGSSRIGASIIRNGGRHADAEACELEPAPSAGDVTSSLLSYIPVLPQHLLSFFGLSRLNRVETVGERDTSATQASYTSYLPSIPDWVSNLFSFNAFSNPSSVVQSVEDAGDGSRAEEWEYAIPDFNPTSLSSTPRPVYRRKRPVPSASNGFAISALASPSNQQDLTDARPDRRSGVHPTEAEQTNQNRYSVVHIDGLGVGRRAFFRGMPDADALHF